MDTREAGRKGGQATSATKSAASAANGAKGGRPITYRVYVDCDCDSPTHLREDRTGTLAECEAYATEKRAKGWEAHVARNVDDLEIALGPEGTPVGRDTPCGG